MKSKFTHIISLILLMNSLVSISQDNETAYLGFKEPEHSLWLGSYMNFRLTEKLFWAGEFHYRQTEYNGVQFVGRPAQIYNRHGIKYVYSKNFSATLGGVLRLNFTPEPGNKDFRSIVLEPRIWQEYSFALPFKRFMVYHRFRFEHRWTKSNALESSFTFKNRYRYKFLMKIPINSPKLGPKTFYFSPDIELIMQSGSSVPFSPMEDLRLYPNVGYQFNSRIGGSVGMTYTTGQKMDIGDFYFSQRWIMRFNVYISLDFRKFEDKIPSVNTTD